MGSTLVSFETNNFFTGWGLSGIDSR